MSQENQIAAMDPNPFPKKMPTSLWINVFKSFAKDGPNGIPVLKITLECGDEKEEIINTYDVEDEFISQHTSIGTIFRHHETRIKELEAELERYHDMEYRFSCLLCHATGSRMSKTNYDKETMYQVVDQHIEEMIEYRINDMIEDGELNRLKGGAGDE